MGTPTIRLRSIKSSLPFSLPLRHSRDKLSQALSRFSVLQATESWAGPGNEANASLLPRPSWGKAHVTIESFMLSQITCGLWCIVRVWERSTTRNPWGNLGRVEGRAKTVIKFWKPFRCPFSISAQYQLVNGTLTLVSSTLTSGRREGGREGEGGMCLTFAGYSWWGILACSTYLCSRIFQQVHQPFHNLLAINLCIMAVTDLEMRHLYTTQ